MQTLQGSYQTNLAEQQSALAHINSVLEPVLNAGPNQTGYSAQELAALNTQAIDTTAGNYASEAKALNTQTAGRNAGGNLPESGVDQALKAGIASKEAGTLSNEELGITESNYATGRSNFNNAVSGEMSLAGQYNPVSTAGAANTANENAFSEANTINTQANAEDSAIASGITSLAMGAAGGIAGGFGNLDTTGGSSGGEQAQNFLSGFAGSF